MTWFLRKCFDVERKISYNKDELSLIHNVSFVRGINTLKYHCFIPKILPQVNQKPGTWVSVIIFCQFIVSNLWIKQHQIQQYQLAFISSKFGQYCNIMLFYLKVTERLKLPRDINSRDINNLTTIRESRYTRFC